MTTRIYATKRGEWVHLRTDEITHEGILVSERGEFLGFGKATSIEALRDDLGFGNKNPGRTKDFDKRYPGGWRIIWCRSSRDPRIKAALRLLRAKDPEALGPPSKDEATTFVASTA